MVIFFVKVFHCVHLEAPAQVPLDLNTAEVEQEISNLQVTNKLVSKSTTNIIILSTLLSIYNNKTKFGTIFFGKTGCFE